MLVIIGNSFKYSGISKIITLMQLCTSYVTYIENTPHFGVFETPMESSFFKPIKTYFLLLG